MKRLFLLSGAMIFSATMTMAAITANDVVATYQSKGYTTIEVATGLTQIKVEAVLGNRKLEAIYDIATGAILSQETSRVDQVAGGQGVTLTTVTHDFGGTKVAEGDHHEGDNKNGAGEGNSGDGNSGGGQSGNDHEKADHGEKGDKGGDHQGGAGGND